MKSITIASSNKSVFDLAMDNAKAADSNYPKGYYECIGSRRRDCPASDGIGKSWAEAKLLEAWNSRPRWTIITDVF